MPTEVPAGSERYGKRYADGSAGGENERDGNARYRSASLAGTLVDCSALLIVCGSG
jgi:hypothetical protein